MKKITLLAMSLMMALVVKAQSGTDVTSLLVNPDFESSTDGWTTTGGVKIAGTAADFGYNATSFMENWIGSDQNLSDLEWSQTIEVPNGVYAVKALAHAVKQSDGTVVPSGVVIYANADEVAVTTTNTNPPTEYAVATVVTNGTLTIGYRIKSGNVNWAAWDNIRIMQYIADTEDAAKTMWAKDEMALLAEDLTALMDNYMSAALKEEIKASIAAIETVADFAAADALWTKMKQQKADATACVEAYENLVLKIEDIYAKADEYGGADVLYDAADAANDKYEDGLLDAAGALAEIEALNETLFEYQMSIATGDIAFDVTEKYMTNPTLRKNSDGWQGSKPGLEYEVQEFYNCDFDIYQELTGIPNGKYVVMVQGFYREAGNDKGAAYAAGSENITAKLYANNASVPLLSLYKYTASEMGVTADVQDNYVNMRYSTNMAFNTYNELAGANYYTENKLEVIVFDGTLKIGLVNTGHRGSSWCTFRDFKLYYYGNFPSVNLAGKIASIRDYIAKNGDKIPYAAWMEVDNALYEYEAYAEEGAFSDEEVDAVIIALDELWNKTLEAVDLFAELKAQVNHMENDLIPLGFDGEDALWDLIEEAKTYFDSECEENTYEALQELKVKLDAGIKDYYLSQEATTEIAADFTVFVPNPNFEQKGEWTWSVVGGGTDQWNGGCRPTEEGGANRQGVNLWGWGITSVDVHQTLTGLPNGLYKVSAELITQGNYATDQHVYAAGANTATSDYLTVEGWDNYEWTTLTTNDFAVVVDGTLTIGAASSKGGSNSEAWFQATNFKLYYHGPASEEHLKAAWESVKTKATEGVAIMLPSEKTELNAALQQATPVAEAGNYAEACAVVNPVLSAWAEVITATENFYDGYYGRLDTLRNREGYEECVDVFKFSDAVVALADVILASDTTTHNAFSAMNSQLQAYASYAAALRDAELIIKDTAEPIEAKYVEYFTSEIVMPQVEVLLASLCTVEYTNDATSELQSKLEALKQSNNINREVEEGDVTYLITNPTIETVEGEDLAGWTILKNNAQNCGTNNNEHYSNVGGVTNAYLDAWHPNAGTMNATFYQELIGIPDGTYKLTVAARADGSGAYIFAAPSKYVEYETTRTVEVKNYGAWRGEIWTEDSLAWEAAGCPTAEDVELIEEYPYFMARPDAETGLGTGYGWSWHVIDNIEVTGHYLKIGFSADKDFHGLDQFNGTWMGADDWSLELIKKSEVQSEFNPFTTDIEDVKVEVPAMQGIYDLFGRRIEAVTAPGIYIVNGKKVLVK